MAIKSPSLKQCWKCSAPAKFYNQKKYWCGYDKELNGVCKNANKKNGD